MNAMAGLYPGDAAAIVTLTLAVQIAIVVGIAALVARLAGRQNAAATYGIWFSALLCIPLGAAALVALNETGTAWITLPVLAPENPAASEDAAVCDLAVAGQTHAAQAVGQEHAMGAEWLCSAGQWFSALCPDAKCFRGAFVLFMVVWAVGVVWLVARTVRGLWLLASIRRDMRGVGRGRLGDSPEQIRQMLGMRAFPAVMTSRRIGSPISLGIFRPVIVLPEDLVSKLSVRALRDVLIHECAHFLKRDHWVGLLERVVQIALWPHPAIHFLRGELDRAREEVCDNYVLRSGDVPCYARTLLEISRHAPSRWRAVSPAIGILEGHWLERRVAGMLDKRRKLVTRINRAVFFGAVTAFLFADSLLAGIKLVPRQMEPNEQVVAATAHAEVNVEPAAPVARVEEAANIKSTQRNTEVLAATQIVKDTTSEKIAAHAARSEPSAVKDTTAAGDSVPRGDLVQQTPAEPAETAALPADGGSRRGTSAVVQVAATEKAGSAEDSAADLGKGEDSAWVAENSGPAVDSVAYLQPAMRIDRVDGSFLVALRVGDEPQPLFSCEPGKLRTISFSSGVCQQITLDVTIEADARSENLTVSYRLAVQIDPETVHVWQFSRAECRLATWNLLTLRPADTPLQGGTEVQSPASTPAPPASATSFGSVRRLLDGAMRALSSEGM